ncbi:MAG: GAF domain-containing protein, partial [Fimbriimonadales bacterium]
MWALRVVGLASLGGVLWHRHGAVAEWAVWGALACAALGASWLERRRAGWFTCPVSLAADYSLATALFWAMGGAGWCYWVFVIPLLHALWRWGTRGAWLSAPFSAGAIATGSLLLTGEPLPRDPQPLSWAVGLAALSVALGWIGRVREQTDYTPLIQQAEQALAESEAAERRIRERYRELTHYYRRLEEQMQQLQDEADLLQALQRARDPDTIHRALLERLRARFGASGAALYLMDETGVHIQAVSALGALAHLAGAAVRTPHQPFQRAPEPAQVTEQLRRAVLSATDLNKAQTPPERYAPTLVLPLLTDGRLLGALALTTNAPEGFSDATHTRLRNLLPHFSTILALTEQIRLMSVRLAETQFLYDVENLLFSAETTLSLPQRALNLLGSIIPFEHAQLALKRNQQIEIAAQVGDLPDLRAYLSEMNAWTQAQIVSPDESQAFAPARSLLIVPLRGGVRTEGALILGRTQNPPFNQADLELIQPLTIHLTSVLE